jgi:hypothetical protein
VSDLTTLVEFLSKGGLVGVLVAILIAGMKGYWVWGWSYKECLERERQLRQERDEWRDLAVHGMDLADRGINLAGDITSTTRHRS